MRAVASSLHAWTSPVVSTKGTGAKASIRRCLSPCQIRQIAVSSIFRIAVEQFDRDALRPTQKANLDAGSRRMRLLGELDAFGFEVGGDGINAGDREAEMIEALIGRGRRCVDAITRRDRRNEDVGTAKLEIDARFASLRRADHL